MKKILYSDMNSLGSIMDGVVNTPQLKKGLKKATLFKFWEKVVGKKFEKVSKIIGLDNLNGKNILTVACANAIVTSELMMFKQQLIKKMNTYSTPLDIEIEDILFSHKVWKADAPKDSFIGNVKIQTENPYKENLEGYNPDEIEVDEKEINEIKANIEANSVLSAEQKERLFNSILNDIKVQKFLNK